MTNKIFQTDLFGVKEFIISKKFPSTRYQGSKSKIINWIKINVENLYFNSVLDIFGGTGAVSYMFKSIGKKVIYNDYLTFNSIIANALIKNNDIKLSNESLEFILKKHSDIDYPSIIEDNFEDIYFTEEENRWLDVTITNINLLEDEFEKSIALFALFQSCITKRPYNLFHRKNLYVRNAEVNRTFGNKKTWDTSFEHHFRKFVIEANNSVFNNFLNNKVYNVDCLDLEESCDLVYLDPPYISKTGVGVNYFSFYHFLEGLVDYDNWKLRIDYNSKHKQLLTSPSLWCDKQKINKAFDELISKHQKSIIVISYRDDGIPSIPQICEILDRYNKNYEIKYLDYKYVLSSKKSREVLIITD